MSEERNVPKDDNPTNKDLPLSSVGKYLDDVKVKLNNKTSPEDQTALQKAEQEVRQQAVIKKTRFGITACLIVKDELKELKRCLTSIRPYVDDILVMGTDKAAGFSAQCTSMANAEFQAKELMHEWDYNFAKARNICMSMAETDWVLVIDADEILVIDPKKPNLLRNAVKFAVDENVKIIERNKLLAPDNKEKPIGAFMINVISEHFDRTTEEGEQPRLFRRMHEYKGFVHESIIDSLVGAGHGLVPFDGIFLSHSGYQNEVVRAKKIERNLEICQHEIDETDTAIAHYNLGKLLMNGGKAYEAYSSLQNAVARLPVDLNIKVDKSKVDPAAVEIYNTAANFALKAGVLDNVVEYTTRSLHILPKQATPYVLLGLYYTEKKQKKVAFESFDKARNIYNDNLQSKGGWDETGITNELIAEKIANLNGPLFKNKFK